MKSPNSEFKTQLKIFLFWQAFSQTLVDHSCDHVCLHVCIEQKRTTMTLMAWKTIALSLTCCSFSSFLGKLSFSSSTTTCQITTSFILSSLPIRDRPPSHCKWLASCLWLQKSFASHTSGPFCCLWHYRPHHSSHPPRVHIWNPQYCPCLV